MFTKIFKKSLIVVLAILCTMLLFNNAKAQQTEGWNNSASSDAHAEWSLDYTILPEIEESWIKTLQEKVEQIWKTWWKVMETYTKTAEKLTLEEQLATWIMNRDTILNYLVYVVKFLSQLWLAIGTIFIMFAGYKYIVSVFNWWKADSKTLKNAIIWVIIVIFSFAIMKFLTSIVWIS